MISSAEFRTLCHRHRLAATHQRQVIYEAAMSLSGHPSPEEIYERAKRKIPAISLATVYKNIRTFLDSGMLQEVSLHHGSLRLEPNHEPHHHLVCVSCKSVTDLDASEFDERQLHRGLPHGFRVKRIAVDILGVCEKCSSAGAAKHK